MTPSETHISAIKERVDGSIAELLAAFPNPARLTTEERRGIIARYSAVLEGNFIYWMTGALLSIRSDEARRHIVENLLEEVRDAHPLMMRKFALAAHAFPEATDSMAVNENLTKVRRFIGKLQPVPIVVTMAFFECFIQQFMAYLADLASRQGSREMEYTDVHGVCDIAHTEGLYQALEAEIAASDKPLPSEADLFEGVDVLGALIRDMARA
jgi:hypothetical protein